MKWEVLPEQVEFKEEIGRGAFGKVLRGVFRESPGIEVFYESKAQTADFKDGQVVAVKLLEGKRLDSGVLMQHNDFTLQLDIIQ